MMVLRACSEGVLSIDKLSNSFISFSFKCKITQSAKLKLEFSVASSKMLFDQEHQLLGDKL